jgi:hypothetical protein
MIWCKLLGHKYSVCFVGGNWYDAMCSRCGVVRTHQAGFEGLFQALLDDKEVNNVGEE